MRTFWGGLVIGLLILPILAAIYIATGRLPAAATDGPMPFERIIAGGALQARVLREAPKRDLGSFGTADFVAGAGIYKQDCAFCHGLPQQPSIFGPHMFPDAPQLFTPDGMVTDDPVGETFWKVQNGIRLTGMPSFETSLNEQQMWQVSALVAGADKLPPEAVSSLKAVPNAATTPAPGTAPEAQPK